jgi:hypothetical protein
MKRKCRKDAFTALNFFERNPTNRWKKKNEKNDKKNTFGMNFCFTRWNFQKRKVKSSLTAWLKIAQKSDHTKTATQKWNKKRKNFF